MTDTTLALIAEDLLGIKKGIKNLAEGIKVTHIQQGQKYKIVIERAASTKGIVGFRVEANGEEGKGERLHIKERR